MWWCLSFLILVNLIALDSRWGIGWVLFLIVYNHAKLFGEEK